MGEAAVRADELWHRCFSRPQEVVAHAPGVVGDALAEGDVEAACAALRAEGMAHRALRSPRRALPPLDRAVRLARAHHCEEAATLPLVTRAGTHLSLGHRRSALRDIDRALRSARPEHVGPAHVQKAYIHLRLGQPSEALAASTIAIDHLRRTDDRQSLATALMNRGIARTYLGHSRRAQLDLARAKELYEEAGDEVQAATAVHNIGFAALHAGDIPGALTQFDTAAELLAELGVFAVEIQLDRCDALLTAGLAGEAAELADDIRRRLDRRGLATELGEALLMLARANASLSRDDAARTTAIEARRIFHEVGRPRWSAEADLVLVDIASRREDADASTLNELLATSRRLDAAGLEFSARRADLAAGVVALRLDDRRRARRCLERVSRLRRSASAERRLIGWTAEARLRVADLSPHSAMRAVNAGVAALEEMTALLGAPDLEAGVARSGSELLALGLDLAMRGGHVPTIFTWAERSRARALRRVAVREGDDPEERRELARMRALAREEREGQDLDVPSADIRRELARIEASIRNRSRRRGASVDQLPAVARLDDVRERLDSDTTLIEFFEHGRQLHALVISSTRSQQIVIRPSTDIDRAAGRLMLALRRLRAGSQQSHDTIRRAAEAVDEAILGPLRELLSSAVVIAPPARLFGVPWRLLPDLAGIDVTVAPSASVWLRATDPVADRKRRVVLASGPGLDWAQDEVEQLASVHPDATVLTGAEATVGAVLDAAEGGTLVHLAAHGEFRADNPLFSSIQLADGPLTGYDVQRLHQPPDVVVLANCESGRTTAHPGDEMVGVSAALLRLGTKSVVSTAIPVIDQHTRPMMIRFHTALARGERPARALTTATPDPWANDAAVAATEGSFVVFGAG